MSATSEEAPVLEAARHTTAAESGAGRREPGTHQYAAPTVGAGSSDHQYYAPTVENYPAAGMRDVDDAPVSEPQQPLVGEVTQFYVVQLFTVLLGEVYAASIDDADRKREDASDSTDA